MLSEIIDSTLRMSVRSDGFWERWLVHGLVKEDLDLIRHDFISLDNWLNSWVSLAREKEIQARLAEENGDNFSAEKLYRTASLYYNLAQWVQPLPSDERKRLMEKLQEIFIHADKLSIMSTYYETLEVEGHLCHGRIRKPVNPKACVLIITPIDSSKEELYTYEDDFLSNGFITICFDGPGQGGTFLSQGKKAWQSQIKLFIDSVVDLASEVADQLPLYTFGISSGGAWALHTSCNEKVSKTVSVSPAVEFQKMYFSTYFSGRLFSYLEDHCIPDYQGLEFLRPVFMFHGEKDKIVPESEILSLYNSLPVGKMFISYPEESHCCNSKLSEIRKLAVDWFLE